jgi:predicted dehydrogenase/threonine dehydrogenase-like Zn-dependent dehydrogenase
MKQVVRKGLSEIVVDEVPAPIVTAHSVVVQPLYSLISSGTETANIHREGVLKEVSENPSHLRKLWEVMKTAGPVNTLREVSAKFREYGVLGYSGAGWIVDKHPTVSDLEVGERVAYGGEGTGHAEYVLAGRQLVTRVPESVSLEHACFTTLGSIALNAVRIADIGLGDTVVVIGLGLVGQLASQLARLQGAHVIGVDLKTDRIDLAKRLGAEHGLSAEGGLREAVSELTNGRGADRVIVAAAAKSSAPCQQALQICRDRGRIVVVGAVEMSFPWLEMYLKEIQLFMARAYGPGSYDPAYERGGNDYPISYVRWTENRNMEEFLRQVESGGVQLDPLITHRFRIEDASAAYETILTPASASLAVVLSYPAASAAAPTPARRRVVEIAPRPAAANEIRFALVGAGNIARWAHLPSLRKLPEAKLYAVYSASGVRGKSYGMRYGAAYCTSNYDDVLGDPNVDAVIIASRNQFHASQAVEALRAGKHVFVEKPMALTEEECHAVCRASDESGKVLMVGFNRRFAPYYIEFKRRLASRAGTVVLNGRFNSPGISGSYWMANPDNGGAILGEACHFVDLFSWILDAEPIEVSAYSLPAAQLEPLGMNNMVASFRFADGSIANLTYCTVGSKTSGGERLEGYAAGIGVITENFKRLDVHTERSRTNSRWFGDKGYAAQMAAFVACIRDGSPSPVTARDGTRATVSCLRMLESSRTRRPCPIDWQMAVE